MIVLLVSINVLFYCIKMNLDSSFTIMYTLSAMLISLFGIFIYKQSSKRISKVSVKNQ